MGPRASSVLLDVDLEHLRVSSFHFLVQGYPLPHVLNKILGREEQSAGVRVTIHRAKMVKKFSSLTAPTAASLPQYANPPNSTPWNLWKQARQNGTFTFLPRRSQDIERSFNYLSPAFSDCTAHESLIFRRPLTFGHTHTRAHTRETNELCKRNKNLCLHLVSKFLRMKMLCKCPPKTYSSPRT